MRIIGGQLRGKKLSPVRSSVVRPTSDRLREAVFNIVSGRIEGATVLDLYAGTGALGIEALSRGAHRAVFVDRSRQAVALISRNIQLCGLQHRSTVIRWDIIRNLNCLSNQDQGFDLVFVDPPYDRGLVRPTLQTLLQQRLLAATAQLIVEHSLSEEIAPIPDGLDIRDSRKYGKTLVSILAAVV